MKHACQVLNVGNDLNNFKLTQGFPLPFLINQERLWATEESGTDDSSSGESNNWRSWIFPIGLALVATLLYRFYLTYSAPEQK